MFRIKICGLTDPRDAQLAESAGADAIGLNFYAKSSRYVDPERAQQIAAVVSDQILKVGVFVNSPVEEIALLARQVPLDAIQLHGDEPASFLLELPSLPIIKAFRCGEAGLAPLVEFLAACKQQGRMPTALLIDAAAPGQYGGSGQTVDWTILSSAQDQLLGLPIILAGGLKPENVAQAIQLARPHGVDVASGVEASPGVKDEKLVSLFIQNALQAFEKS